MVAKQPPNLIAVSIENATAVRAFIFTIYRRILRNHSQKEIVAPFFLLSSGVEILQVMNQLIVWGDMDNGHL